MPPEGDELAADGFSQGSLRAGLQAHIDHSAWFEQGGDRPVITPAA